MDQATEKREYMQDGGTVVASVTAIRQRKGYLIAKRAFDVVFSLVLSLLFLIPMAVIAAVIVIKDPGNPFYIHKRIGKNGRAISVLKFRSMRLGADILERMLTQEQLEEYKQEFKLRDDPRLLGYKKPGDGKRCFGALLRKSSLDELPQIPYNVLLKGNMSFVGPRPIMREELDKFYTREEQEVFLSVKPGITGYWQTHGRSDCTYESGERQKLELYYAEHQGIGIDLKILLATVGTVLHMRGTY